MPVRLEIRGVEHLSFRERQVVTLKEMGMGNEAVGRRLGIGAGTVATLHHRARQKGYQVVILVDGDPLDLMHSGEEDAEIGDQDSERSEEV